MIVEFLDRFQEIKKDLLKQFSEKEPDSYEDIFIQTIKMMFEHYENEEICDSDLPDFNRITAIDHGDYQGTQLFIVGASGYQPSKYWATRVDYGSCSGCDTYQAYSDSCNPKESAPHMVTMALHMIESLKEI